MKNSVMSSSGSDRFAKEKLINRGDIMYAQFKPLLQSPVRFAGAALTTLLLLTSSIAVAEQQPEQDGYWGEWEGLSGGFVGRRRVPPKADLPVSERRLATTQAPLKRGKAPLKDGVTRGKKPLKDDKRSRKDKTTSSLATEPVVSELSVTAAATTAAIATTDEVNGLWLRTSAAGLYSASITDLATEFGSDAAEVRSVASAGNLILARAQTPDSLIADQPVSWSYDEAADEILFAAELYDTFYSGENATHFKLGDRKSKDAQPMPVITRKPPRRSGSHTPFAETLKFEEEPDLNFSTWSVASDPDADYWYWDYLQAGSRDSIEVSLEIPNPSVDGIAQLRITLRGWTDLEQGDEHHVYAMLNGEPVGSTVTWDGFEEVVLVADFNQDLLNQVASDNTLSLHNIYEAGTHPGQWLDQVEIDYLRQPVANAGKLWMHDVVAGTQTVTGFTNADIVVIEAPGGDAKLRENILIDADVAGGWSVTFTSGGDADYLLTERLSVAAPVLAADFSSSLSESTNVADYLIISPWDFNGTAEALAGHRGSRYSNVKIVWLDDIYDEFSAGREDPAAIGRFMTHVTTSWQQSPAIVTLVGKGSLDHMDREGYGDSFLPVLMTSTPWALAPSDSRLLGFVDDAPFAIGRLPITNDAEGVAYVDKLMAYESTIPGDERFEAVLVADNPDDAGDFHANSDLLAERLVETLGFSLVTKLYHPESNVRENLIQSATWETGYVSYDGHGSITQLGALTDAEKFLRSGNVENPRDADLLENNVYPIFSALTCAAGDDSYPGYRSLAGALVLNPAGGAIASVAPTGLSLDNDAQTLGNAFVDSLFGDNTTIGDALREAKRVSHGNISAFMPRMYTILGEPGVLAR